MDNPFAYPEELRAEAIRLFREEGKSMRAIGAQLGVSHQTARKWIQAEEEAKELVGTTDEVRSLKRRVRQLEQEREILKKAVAFFARDSEGR
jgi:transposase-like protein